MKVIDPMAPRPLRLLFVVGGILSATFMLSASCSAQTIEPSRPSDIQDVGGFLDICGRGNRFSKENDEVLKNGSPAEFQKNFEQALVANLGDQSMCLAYVSGIIDGWQEGHDHGVLAVYFPEGVPQRSDLVTALKSLSDKDFETYRAANSNDILCLPDRITFGQILEAALKSLREQTTAIPAFRLLPTFRMVIPALQSAYPCPTGSVRVTSIPDGAEVYLDGAFVGNTPATLKLSVGTHAVRVLMHDYKEWNREITVQGGSTLSLVSTLQKK